HLSKSDSAEDQVRGRLALADGKVKVVAHRLRTPDMNWLLDLISAQVYSFTGGEPIHEEFDQEQVSVPHTS
ncbi:MAG: hypothetical protein KC561_07555, partial [Myxococcales bacterium]|nr:hypothetical protein [Myxococcales bacterium]